MVLISARQIHIRTGCRGPPALYPPAIACECPYLDSSQSLIQLMKKEGNVTEC